MIENSNLDIDDKMIIPINSTVAEIIALYLKPSTVRYVAEFFGITEYYTKQILIEHNIPLHSAETNKQLIAQATKEAIFDRYGVDSPFALEEVQEKSKQTCMEKYGVDNYAKKVN